jgi:hypothetical protein
MGKLSAHPGHHSSPGADHFTGLLAVVHGLARKASASAPPFPMQPLAKSAGSCMRGTANRKRDEQRSESCDRSHMRL